MRLLFGAAFLAATLSAPTTHAEIGVLAAVNRDMTGARPAEQARPIFINDRLVQDETIETTVDGGGQVLFLDQTSLTIAPNSSIVLDQYVYDPDSDSGSIGITVARGAMRMIGGRVTKTTPATIRTPSATIGIRGGMGNISVSPDGTVYMHVAGISSTIDTDNGSLTITQQGGVARVLPDGVIDYLGVATSDIISVIFGAASTGTGGGGIPTPAAVSNAGGGIGGQISGDDGILDASPISTTGEQQGGAFGDLAVDLEVVPTEEFAEIEVTETITDDLQTQTDAVAFAGLYSGNVLLDNGIMADFIPFDNGNIFVGLNMVTGEGATSIAFPFDTGSAIPEENLIADILPLRIINGEVEGIDPSALGAISEGELVVANGRASGFFILDYFETAIPLIDANGDTILAVDGEFDVPEVPGGGEAAQALIDAGNLLVTNEFGQ